jgi:hypothetical protein
MMDKVHKPNSSVQHTPSSESFQDYELSASEVKCKPVMGRKVITD